MKNGGGARSLVYIRSLDNAGYTRKSTYAGNPIGVCLRKRIGTGASDAELRRDSENANVEASMIDGP